MIRFRNDLFAMMLFACVFLGRPGGVSAQAPGAAAESSETLAADANAESSEKAVLKAVLETRDEVRALRHEVDNLRKVLESPSGKSGSDRQPERVERFGRDGITLDGAGLAHVRHADGKVFVKDSGDPVVPPFPMECIFSMSRRRSPREQMRPIVDRLQRESFPSSR